MSRFGPKPRSVAVRLAAKVAPDPETGCLLWTGAKSGKGYGKIGIGVGGRSADTHRVAWTIRFGPIPRGQCVLHRCDNPACCNVDHLFLGTIADNNRDMIAKGRGNNQKKTQCPSGHAYDETNTGVIVLKTGKKVRYCRICRSVYGKDYHKRKRETSIKETTHV